MVWSEVKDTTVYVRGLTVVEFMPDLIGKTSSDSEYLCRIIPFLILFDWDL